MSKKIVVLGIFGTVLDNVNPEKRWTRWRPTLSIGQQKDLQVARLELIYQPEYVKSCELLCEDFHQVSPATEIRLHEQNFASPWDFETVYAELLDFAKKYPFDPEHEDYLVHITTGTHVMQICLFLLVESRIIPARILQTGGTERKKPVGGYNIIDLDLSKYDRLAARFKEEHEQGIHYLKAGIPTRNPRYNRLIEQLARVSMNSNDPILITGPSGVGKTRLARLVYEWKKSNCRVMGQFVELNCATLKGSAAMSALFGHVKGAYTDARTDRAGLLMRADGGLLFLDEIGELEPEVQAMLLRALEEKRFYPLGSDRECSSNFQLICGTNRDLEAMCAQGTFRADLLARIDLWSFRLLSLKDRPEDLEPNLDYELERVSEKLGHRIRMNTEARALFLKLATSPDALWSGNFRELGGCVTRMGVLADSARITEEVVREEFERLRARWHDNERSSAEQGRLDDLLGSAAGDLDLFERCQLETVVGECMKSGTLSEAGRRLFAKSRERKSTGNDADRLRKYLARYGLEFGMIRHKP